MEKSSFFNAISDGATYDRIYKAEDFADYFATFIGTGVFSTPSSSLQVIANNDMTIKVSTGKAWINGYYYNNTENLTFSLATSNGVLKRVDRVVIRLDLVAREIKAKVLTGTPSSTPVAPELTRNDEIYELGLADITVDKGALSITQANISDLRFNNSYCGVVKGTVEEIDTTDLFAQYQTIFDEFSNSKKEEFDAWFNNLKNELDENQATNLQRQIDEVKVTSDDWATFKSNGGIIENPVTINDKIYTKYLISLDKFARLFSIDNRGVMVDTNANRFVPSITENLSLGDGMYKWTALHLKGGKAHFVDTLGDNGALSIQTDNGKQLVLGVTSEDGTKVNQLKIACNNDGGRYLLPSMDKSVNLGSEGYRWKSIWLKDFSRSKNGYTILPNDLILQWGEVNVGGINGLQINYPIQFPNNILSVVATVNSNNKGTTPVHTWVTGRNTSNFYARTSESDTNINWMAIGY